MVFTAGRMEFSKTKYDNLSIVNPMSYQSKDELYNEHK